ncbi:MAG: histidine kinase N-terminal 7TM domain-containing protein [Natronomonas sp.]
MDVVISLLTPGSWLGALVVGLSIGAGVGTVALVWYLSRYRGRPGANWFLLTLSAQAVWCLSYGVGLFVFDPTLRYVLEVSMWIGIIWTGIPFLAFALAYTGRGHMIRSPGFLPIVVLGGLGTALAVSNHTHGLLFGNFAVDPVFGIATVSYSFTPITFVLVAAVSIAVAAGVTMLFDTVFSYGPLYRREATAVALSTLPPTIGLYAWLFEFGPYPELNLAPALFVPHVVLDAYAFVGTNMFESDPVTHRTAERSAVDDLPNPVVILDTNGRIITANNEASRLFGSTVAVDTNISRLLPATEIDPETAGDTPVTIETVDGRRSFLVSTSALTDPRGIRVGTTVVLQDITSEQRREQRLQVFNRLLRHNLRNEMVPIKGHASQIASTTDEEHTAEMANAIVESSERLLDTVDKAQTFEKIQDDRSPSAVDTVSVLTGVATALRERFPEARIDVETPLSSCRTDQRILELVFRNLGENALESGATHVRFLAFDSEDGTATFRVIDDGPGIPASEIAPIQEGAETALTHGSGIGLWLVTWSVDLAGGDIEFDTGDGTVVTVRLPNTG